MPKRSRPYEVGLNQRLRDPEYAISYLNAFMSNTEGFNRKRRKALMDGMLFEIFFEI